MRLSTLKSLFIDRAPTPPHVSPKSFSFNSTSFQPWILCIIHSHNRDLEFDVILCLILVAVSEYPMSSSFPHYLLFSCPDDAPVRRRMLYASSVRALKATLGLESLMQVQASDLSDIDEKAIKSELMAHQRV